MIIELTNVHIIMTLISSAEILEKVSAFMCFEHLVLNMVGFRRDLRGCMMSCNEGSFQSVKQRV